MNVAFGATIPMAKSENHPGEHRYAQPTLAGDQPQASQRARKL